MKKIVGILGMAAMLGSAAFAADPAANFVMTKFNGSAEFGVEANFVEKDAKFGMYNKTPDLELAFGFVTAGSKATTGDGVWGEIAISSKESAAPAMPAAPTVDTAKIHLVNGNFTANLNILNQNLKLAEYTPFVATPVGIASKGVDATTGLTNGFALELGLADMFASNIKVMDNGLAKDKKFGMLVDFDLKAVDNLTLYAGAAMNFSTKYTGIQAKAAYDIKIGDTMYVKPGVAFETIMQDKKDAAMNLAGGVMFGWGAKEVDANLKYISNKTSEGVSVAVSTDMKDNGLKLGVSLYDQSLLSLIGDDFGTLKSGVQFIWNQDKANDNELLAAVDYGITIDVITLGAYYGMQMKMPQAEKAENTVNFKVGGSVTAKVIANTDLYVSYDYEKAAKVTKDSTLKVGTKIHF